MSTVLTNGIIIPDNGNRNWGGDLANNWNILDVHVGYMTDVKNRVTTLENSVAENTANIEINASNISALQTSKQDNLSEQQLANIADVTNKANDSDVVHKSGNETISGNKTWSGLNTFQQNITYERTNFFHQAVNPCYYLKDTELEKGSLASTHTAYPALWCDKNSNVLGYVRFVEYSSGRQTAEFRISNLIKNGTLDPTGSVVNCTVNLELQSSGEKSLIPEQNNDINLGTSTNKWKDIYATNGAINTSDRNAKTDIKIIDDNILEAWDKVSLVSFKFKDAVAKKGDEARIHTGYIAQDIKEELNKYGIDACRYGLFCYNAWDAQEEKSHEEERTDEAGNIEIVKVIDTPARDTGEIYGLRYIECLVVECAYLRKKNKELDDRITKLEKNLNA